MMAAPSRMPTVVLYTRPGCSLCYTVRREAARLSRHSGIPLQVINISGDADLEARYGSVIPVLQFPGGDSLQGRPTSADLEAAFRRAIGHRGVARGPRRAGLRQRILAAVRGERRNEA